jgi:hypothetical protein
MAPIKLEHTARYKKKIYVKNRTTKIYLYRDDSNLGIEALPNEGTAHCL